MSDLVNSLLYMFWALPSHQDNVDMWGAMDNQATCEFAGFVAHLGNVGAGYNVGLAIYFFLSI
jgi:hypothetical protein